MPRRGENVYKRKDGRWEGRILKPEGRYQYFYAKSYRGVKDKMRASQKPGKANGTKQPGWPKNAAGLFELWLEEKGTQVKPSTYENYYFCMKNYVIPFFRKEENRQITPAAVSQFVKSIKEHCGLADSYKKKILAILKTALRDILKNSPECPAILESVKLPKSESQEVQVFSFKEQRLIENVVLHWEDRRALGIILCFYTGIRLGELCALRWSDFDQEAGTMSIIRTVSRTKSFQQEENRTALLIGIPKSKKSVRKIPLPAFLLKLAGEFKMYFADENRYVLSGKNTPIDPRSYQKLFKKVLEEAGVKDRKFHAIRHTFATRALELGVDIKTLSEILGHSNVSITLNIYAHSLMEQKKIAIDKLNEMHINYMRPALLAVKPTVIQDKNQI